MAADMDEPNLSEEWHNLQVDRGAQWGRPEEIIRGVSTVWILASNLGSTKEGLYIMKDEVRKRPDDYFVLAFEKYDDAERYAHLASSPDFDLSPVQWQTEQLISFCLTDHFEVAFAQKFVIPASTDKFHYDVLGKVVRGRQSGMHWSQKPNSNVGAQGVSGRGKYGYGRRPNDGRDGRPRGVGPSSMYGSTTEQYRQPNRWPHREQSRQPKRAASAKHGAPKRAVSAKQGVRWCDQDLGRDNQSRPGR
jgi:hypothetical protein